MFILMMKFCWDNHSIATEPSGIENSLRKYELF